MKSRLHTTWIMLLASVLFSFGQNMKDDVIVYRVTNYESDKQWGHVYHIGFSPCSVSEPNLPSESPQLLRHSFSRCIKGERIRFTVTYANGYVIDYDWVLAEGGRTIKGAYRDSNGTWGPSIGKAERSYNRPPSERGSLQGRWVAYRDGNKVADCSIVQQADALTFIIHRSPEERSSGKWTGANEVLALDWGKNALGKINKEGNRIDWPGSNSYWLKVEDNTPPPTTKETKSIQGKWVAYRSGSKVADCSIVQGGTAITFIIHRSPEERSIGKWTGANEVQAIDWGNNVIGRVSTDGKRIDWPSTNSHWIKVE